MSLRDLIEFRHTLVFRLTMWYTAIFAISTSVVFIFFYFLLTAIIKDKIDQDLHGKVNRFSRVFSNQGVNTVIRNAIIETQAAGEEKIFFRLIDLSGQVFSSSNISYWEDIKVDENVIYNLLRGSDYVFQTISATNRKHKVRVLYSYIDPGIVMQLGHSMENSTRIFEVFRKTFFVTMSAIIIFAALIGSFLAKRALSGVWKVTRTAQHISEGSIDERVPVTERGDELDQLATTFNQMLDRIQKLIITTKEMSDNIAHDLRSPVTRIRGEAEIAITTSTSIDEYQNMASGTVEECDRLLDMINTMLIISKTESGVQEINKSNIDIVKTLKSACDLFQPMAKNKGLKLICNNSDNIMLNGDTRKIQRMIANLLDNAIKYSTSEGNIYLSAFLDNEKSVVISVKDTGIGIEDKDIPHIFNRFYRCDPSRPQGGAGLGLSLAKAIVEAHDGKITVKSVKNAGSTFIVTIPNEGSSNASASFA